MGGVAVVHAGFYSAAGDSHNPEHLVDGLAQGHAKEIPIMQALIQTFIVGPSVSGANDPLLQHTKRCLEFC